MVLFTSRSSITTTRNYTRVMKLLSLLLGFLPYRKVGPLLPIAVLHPRLVLPRSLMAPLLALIALRHTLVI